MEIPQGRPPKHGRPATPADWPERGRSPVAAATMIEGFLNILTIPPFVNAAAGDRPRSGWGRGLLYLACAAVFCAAAVRGASAEAPALSETQIKALFLFNFTKYVEWPENAFASPTAPLTVGLIGNPDLAQPLRELVAGKTFMGHPIVIDDNVAAGHAVKCHILFFGASRAKDLPSLLPPLQSKPLLTVGENEKFTRLGGIVNFGRRDNKVRLEINTVTAAESRLKLSAKLLGVAEVVQYKP